MIETDAVFLAHIRKDEHAQRCVKRIFGTRDAAWPKGVQLPVVPWFVGRGSC